MIKKVYCFIILLFIFINVNSESIVVSNSELKMKFNKAKYIIKAKIKSGKIYNEKYIYQIDVLISYNNKGEKLNNNENIMVISDYSLKIGVDYLMFLRSASFKMFNSYIEEPYS